MSETILEVGPGFWNFRGSFKRFLFIDLGVQMSLLRLSSGKFLVLDTIELDEKTKNKLDELTDNGQKIEAVIGTHPFHTLAFPDFYRAYPHVPYYGTPRHIRKLTNIGWAGNLNECSTRNLWAPDVEIRIPDGSEFVSPEPESSNHFSSCWVFHRESRTIHIDDTLIYAENPQWIFRLIGISAGYCSFHPSIKGPGLYPTKEAPFLFRDWLAKLLEEWDFDNVCTAHNGNKIGGAKDMVKKTLSDAEPMLEKLSKDAKRSDSKSLPNFTGSECG